MRTQGIQRGFNLQFALARVGNRRGKSAPVPCVGHFDLCHILKVSRGAHAGRADDTPTRWARRECTKSHTRSSPKRDVIWRTIKLWYTLSLGLAAKFMGFRRRHFSNYYVDGAFSYFPVSYCERAASAPEHQYWRCGAGSRERINEVSAGIFKPNKDPSGGYLTSWLGGVVMLFQAVACRVDSAKYSERICYFLSYDFSTIYILL
jgi:hypothetical protein